MMSFLLNQKAEITNKKVLMSNWFCAKIEMYYKEKSNNTKIVTKIDKIFEKRIDFV